MDYNHVRRKQPNDTLLVRKQNPQGNEAPQQKESYITPILPFGIFSTPSVSSSPAVVLGRGSQS